MPSIVASGFNGTRLVNTSETVNKTGSVAKSPVATFANAPNLEGVTLPQPSTLDGSSNDGITTTLVNTLSELNYATATGVNPADQVRRQVELSIAGNPTSQDPFHNTTYSREPVYTASGYFRDQYGQIRNSNGTELAIPVAAATGNYLVNGGLPDQATKANPSHYYRLGLTNTEDTMEARTQV
jgi:hypothetical protein